MKYDIVDLLKEMHDLKASDLHITVGKPPVYRVNGELISYGEEKLSPEDTRNIVYQIMNEVQIQKFESQGELDFSFGIPGLGRYRVNAYRQRATVAAALRRIPFEVPHIDDLGLPEVVKDLIHKRQGLILVTGPTGSGKSTTLASLIQQINITYPYHILTIEDPIEYVFRHGKSMVNQREVGADTLSFANALRAALREDPDVVMVGEMRDLETIQTVLTLAETGHLVFATVHTNSAAQTIDRIVDVFPPHQQPQVRIQLSSVLIAVISQRLLKRSDGRGRVLAAEIMIANSAIRALIREGKTHQILSHIQMGASEGMQPMDKALAMLVKRGLVDYDEALHYVHSLNDFNRYLGM